MLFEQSPKARELHEKLSAFSLETYLRQHLADVSGPLTVEQFPHGHSNLTYLVRLGNREFVLRRPPIGNQVKTAHDMGREYRVLSKLCAVYPPAPRPFLYCEDTSILGTSFYVMERRRGIILRKTLPPNMAKSPDMARRLCTSLIDNLATLHCLDFKAAGLADLGKPEGYVARQVTGWIDRYAKAQTDDLPEMGRLAQWLTEHMPQESSAALLHNDYKYDNLLLDPADPTRIVAVLDWEMATIGHSLMDLGTTLGYWVEADDPEPLRRAAMGPTYLPGSLTRKQLVERYAEKTGRTVSGAVFYYCFGLYKIAVIIQQIYARYVRGHTQDARFADLANLVRLLSPARRSSFGGEAAVKRGQSKVNVTYESESGLPPTFPPGPGATQVSGPCLRRGFASRYNHAILCNQS